MVISWPTNRWLSHGNLPADGSVLVSDILSADGSLLVIYQQLAISWQPTSWSFSRGNLQLVISWQHTSWWFSLGNLPADGSLLVTYQLMVLSWYPTSWWFSLGNLPADGSLLVTYQLMVLCRLDPLTEHLRLMRLPRCWKDILASSPSQTLYLEKCWKKKRTSVQKMYEYVGKILYSDFFTLTSGTILRNQ